MRPRLPLGVLGVLAVLASALPAQRKPKPAPPSAAATAAAALEAKKLVDDWNQNKGTDEKAQAIARLDPAHLRTPLRDALADEETRIRAMDLIGRIRHPQAWDLLSPFVMSEDYEPAIDALTACGDPVTERGLRTIWSKEPDDSDRMTYLSKALATSTLRSESVRFFVAECLAGRHLPHSRKLATKALEVGPETADPDLRKALVKYEERMKLYARDWRIVGTPIDLPSGTKHGDNVLCDSGTNFTSGLPDWCQFEDHTVVLRFLPLEPKHVAVGYASREGAWFVEMLDGKGDFLKTRESREPTSVKQGTWSELQFVVRVDRKQATANRIRRITVSVDGKEMPGPLGFDGDLLGATVQGRCIVGGFCVVKN